MKCEICNYETTRASNYTRHLASKEHLARIEQNESKIEQIEPKLTEFIPVEMSKLKTELRNVAQKTAQIEQKSAQIEQNEPILRTFKNSFAQNEHSEQNEQSKPIIYTGDRYLDLNPIKKEALESILSKDAEKVSSSLQSINKKIKRKDYNNIAKPDSKTALGILALIATMLLVVIFWEDIKKFLASIKTKNIPSFSNGTTFTIIRE